MQTLRAAWLVIGVRGRRKQGTRQASGSLAQDISEFTKLYTLAIEQFQGLRLVQIRNDIHIIHQQSVSWKEHTSAKTTANTAPTAYIAAYATALVIQSLTTVPRLSMRKTGRWFIKR